MTATVYYFIGDNSVDMSEELKRWTGIFREKHSSLSLITADAIHDDEKIVTQALSSSQAGSLFGDINLIILKNILSTKKYEQEVTKLLETKNKNNFFLFFQDEKVEDMKNKKIIEKLEKNNEAVIKEFPIPHVSQLHAWVSRYAKRRGITVTTMRARTIIEALPSLTDRKLPKKESIWFLAKEIDKLIAFCHPKKEINEKAITEIIKKENTFEIWSLTSAILAGKKKESVTLLGRRLNSLPKQKHEGELRMIFAMLNTQIRKLLLIKKINTESEKKVLADAMQWSPAHTAMLNRQAPHVSEKHLNQLQKKLITFYTMAVDEPKNLTTKVVTDLFF